MVLPASHRISRVPWYSGSQLKHVLFRLQDCHLLRLTFPDLFDYLLCSFYVVSSTPIKETLIGLGCFPFARRYLGNRVFFLFLGVLRCFSSPGLPSYTYFIQYMIHGVRSMWVSPFGNLRIKAYLRLPEAYRCLSRPSSAPGAKAFTLCS